MLAELHLVAIVRNRRHIVLLKIPLHQSLQDHLREIWDTKLELYLQEHEQVDFNAGIKLADNECFRTYEFEMPDWIATHNCRTAKSLEEIGRNKETFDSVQGVVAFVRNDQNNELMLFHDFTPSNVIGSGRFLELDGERFGSSEDSGLLLDQKLCAVYFQIERKFLFRNYRAVNSFLPMHEFLKDVSEQRIRELLQHSVFSSENPDQWAKGANQWFRTRFLNLSNSGILDRYSANEIKSHAKEFGISVQIVNDKILFPSDIVSAKKLLRFLNEELYKGVITGTIYVTNFKRRQSGV